jgi:hypothetical protein
MNARKALNHSIDAAQIRASYVRKQKTDRRDARHILRLLMENRFPQLWMPDREQRDLRQLVLHRHKLVEIRSRVKKNCNSFPCIGECSASIGCGVKLGSRYCASFG